MLGRDAKGVKEALAKEHGIMVCAGRKGVGGPDLGRVEVGGCVERVWVGVGGGGVMLPLLGWSVWQLGVVGLDGSLRLGAVGGEGVGGGEE